MAKETFYPQRSVQQLVASARDEPALRKRAGDLAQYFKEKRVDIKKRDAITLLKHVRGLREQKCNPGVVVADEEHGSRSYQGARLHSHQWDSVGLRHREIVIDGKREKVGSLIPNIERVTLAEPLGQALRLRWFVLEWARQNKVVVPDAFGQAAESAWRKQSRVEDLPRWLASRGITDVEHRAYIQKLATVSFLAATMPACLARDWSLREIEIAFALMNRDEGAKEAVRRSQCARLLSKTYANAAHVLAQMEIAYQWSLDNRIECPKDVLEPALADRLARWRDEDARCFDICRQRFEREARKVATVQWLVDKQPRHFGYTYSPALDLVREFQHRGR